MKRRSFRALIAASIMTLLTGVIGLPPATAAVTPGPWQFVRPNVKANPGVATTGTDKSVVLFTSSLDGTLRGVLVTGSTYGTEFNLGGFSIDGVSATMNETGKFTAAVAGGDNQVWHRKCTEDGTTSCNAFTNIGGLTQSTPAVIKLAGVLHFFVRGFDNQLWYNTLPDSTGIPGPWRNLGGIIIDPPAVTSTAANVLEVMVTGQDNRAWSITSNDSGGSWSLFSVVPNGNLLSSPCITSKGNGVSIGAPADMFLFVRGLDNQNWFNRRVGFSWTGFGLAGGILTAGPGCAYVNSAGPDFLQVAVRGNDGNLWVNQFST